MSLIARLSVVAVALAGCVSASRPNPEAERAALMEVSREWAAAAALGDVERILGYWSDDAIVLPPDQPAVVGKEAIREFIGQSMAIPGFTITWEPEQATISSEGDLGYLVERNRFTFLDSTGTVHTQYGKAVTIWRKNSEGEWKCVLDTWNANPTDQVLSTPS